MTELEKDKLDMLEDMLDLLEVKDEEWSKGYHQLRVLEEDRDNYRNKYRSLLKKYNLLLESSS